MPAPVNQMAKGRKADKPYLVFEREGWKWVVLKSYQGDNGKPYARWYCRVSSPHTFGGADMGDTYVKDIVTYGRLTYADPTIDLDALKANLTFVISSNFQTTSVPA